MLSDMPVRVALAIVVAALAAAGARADVLLVRTNGAQIDEAVSAIKGELGKVITSELTVDDARALASDSDIVVAVLARAAQLALEQPSTAVVHCMVLQGAGAFDTDRSVGVWLAPSARAQLSTDVLQAPTHVVGE